MMMNSEDISIEDVNDKGDELKKLYKEESEKDFLSVIGQIVMVGVIVILYSATGFLKNNRKNKYILTYLEEVK